MRSAVGNGPATDRWSRRSLIPGFVLSPAYAVYHAAREHRFKAAEYRAIIVEGR